VRSRRNLLLAAALLLAALSLIGYCIVPRAWQPRGLRLRIPFALSAGAIVTGWVAWVSAAIFGTVAAWIAAAALLLFSVRQVPRWWRDSLRFGRLLTALLRRNPLLASVLCLLIALTIPQLLIPVVDSDGLRYHLAFPKLYLLTGEVNFYPWDVTGGFPHTAEMLYLIALPLGGEVAKFVHTGFFCGNLILLILLIHRGRRTRAAALLGAILFAAAPVATCPAAAAFIDHITETPGISAEAKAHGGRRAQLEAGLLQRRDVARERGRGHRRGAGGGEGEEVEGVWRRGHAEARAPRVVKAYITDMLFVAGRRAKQSSGGAAGAGPRLRLRPRLRLS